METEACPGTIQEHDCATRLVLDRIGDRWTVQIVGALNHGALRFSQLRRALGDVSPKVLTETLRALQRDGVVARTAYDAMPPHVEYTLTDLGRGLQAPINAARTWSNQHAARVADARTAHDRGRQKGNELKRDTSR